VIVVERPGFGVSDPKPARRYLDFPDDLAQLADELGLDRFALAGTSGAGPYLHACGVRLNRITRLGVIACIAPDLTTLPLWRRAVLQVVQRVPSLAKRLVPSDPERFYQLMTRDVPPCDRAIVERIWDSQVEMTREALRQGPEEFLRELQLAAEDWGFRLDDNRAEVVLWHGSLDQAASIESAREVARKLPRCTAHFIDGAGHFLHYDRWSEVLASLTS
jgi:pimeloyl-ACP methyl ester carboxylesterase